MIKKILTYASGEILIKALTFLAVPLYSHLILPREYGILGFLNSLVSFLPFVLTFYYLYAFIRFANEIKPEKLISTYFFLGIFLNLFYISISILIYFLFIKQYEIAFKYFLLSVSSSAIIYLFQILQMYYRSIENAKNYVKMSFFYTIIGLSLNFTFLILFKDHILAMLISSFITSLIVSVISFKILMKYISLKNFDLSLVKKILKYSIPLVPAAISLLIFSQSDKILLIKYISKEQLGIYNLAFTIGLSMSYVGNALFMGYQPMFYNTASKKRLSEIKKQFNKNILLLLCAYIGISIAIYIIYNFFVDSKYKEGIIISYLIALAYCFITFSQIMELHLTYLKKTFLISVIYAVQAIITIISLINFIPNSGTKGAAFALLISSFITSIIMYIVSQKKFYIPYNKYCLIFFYLSLFITGVILCKI